MVKSTKPSFPWDQIKAESMRSLCRDLGLKQPHTTRSIMVDFLESVWKVGLPQALDNASATTPSSALRTSQKRGRDTPTTTVPTASSVMSGDEPSPSKRHRRGPDVTSDYNTRHKADRRGRLSDPGPIKRRRGLPSANGTTILDRPVRTSKKRRLSPPAATRRTSAARRPRRKVTLGEPLASDATTDDYKEDEEEEEEERTSISTTAAKRRRVDVPVVTTPTIIRTRKQKEMEEGAGVSLAASRTRRTITSTPKRAALNGVTRMSDEYQPEQDEEESDYEDEEEEDGEKSIKIRQLPRRSLPVRLPRRFHPRRRRTSPSKPRAATVSPRKPHASSRTGPKPATKAGRGRPRRRPRANSVKFVFDGVDVPPVNVAWKKKKKKKTDDETVHDEDADGEIDEEVHLLPAPEREVTEEQEAQGPTETGEPEEQEQEGGEVAEAGEPAAEEQVPERQDEAGGTAQLEEAEAEEQVETVAEEQPQPEEEDKIMDQGEDELGVVGLIPDDTSSLGNSNKENEAPEGQEEEMTTTTDEAAAEMAAQTVLFGAPITVTTMTTRVEFIGGSEDGGGMEDVHGMEDIDDEMQGPTVEDINSFIA